MCFRKPTANIEMIENKIKLKDFNHLRYNAI
jgi:hypothetical protein